MKPKNCRGGFFRCISILLQKLFQVVKEAEPADTIITNGRVINVFTNGVDEGQAITVTT
ncbi:MAG: hypothetical protein A4E57_00616 [Syntrophorhabdaceae bacterium PtaU1.Bin034]|nr:MAG: hypothetical protein A4E57_00616 [Syntrophorhabdaceae bacterium PtaU1.Bin034]